MKASAVTFEPDATLADRLLALSEPQQNGCRIWVGVTNNNGYGLIKNGPKSQRRMIGAHRAAFTLFVRPLEPGEHVLHRCDVPACVEPSHLFAGDHSANMRDMVAKGRRINPVTPDQAGSQNSQSHLTEDDVREMRRKRSDGAYLRELAAEYHIAVSTVSGICAGKHWRHVA